MVSTPFASEENNTVRTSLCVAVSAEEHEIANSVLNSVSKETRRGEVCFSNASTKSSISLGILSSREIWKRIIESMVMVG